MIFIKRLKNTVTNIYTRSLYGWSKTCNERGEYLRALNFSTRATTLKPDFIEAHIERGIALSRCGHHQDAIATFDHLLADDPRNVDLLVHRGLVHYYNEDYAGAIADYNVAIYYKSTHTVAYLYRGLAEYGQGNLTAAISDYNAAIKCDPNNVVAYRRRADIRVKQGRISDALNDYFIYLQKGVTQAYSQRKEVAALIGELRLRQRR